MINAKNIRAARAADKASIANIAGKTELFPPEMLYKMMSGYLEQTSQDLWFVYEDETQIQSFGFCEPERMTEGTWNLLAIGVLPGLQGQGIGSEMMAYVEGKLAQQGERILLVETMGTPEFSETRAFYRKNAYTEEARIREFYEAGADKVVFWKHL